MREIRTSGSVGGPPSTMLSTVAYPDDRAALDEPVTVNGARGTKTGASVGAASGIP